jgi:hypothetical protein
MERSTKRRRLRVPSPAMVVACIALAIAMSGAGYAAVSLPKNSVGTKQIRNGAVTTAKLHKNAVTKAKLGKNAVTGAKVKDNSLTGADIDESTLSGVNAGTLNGMSSSEFVQKPSGDQFDTYMASGATWIDANSTGRGQVTLTRVNAPPQPSPTQVCTTPGAAPQQGASTANGTAAAFQQIDVPNGAHITNMLVDYGDDASTTTANGTVLLTRMPIFSSNGEMQTILVGTLANTATPGAPFTATDGTVPFDHPEYGDVDTNKYSYVLQAFPTVPATTTLAAASGTTLSVASAPGATGIRVASLANMVVGTSIRIDTAEGGGLETRTILSVDPAAVSPAPNVTLTTPLTLAHASGVGVQPSAVRVSSQTGLAPGQSITIDTGNNAETRTISTVITPNPASPAANITLSSALTINHPNGSNVYVPAASGTPAPLAGVAYCNVRVDFQLP